MPEQEPTYTHQLLSELAFAAHRLGRGAWEDGAIDGVSAAVGTTARWGVSNTELRIDVSRWRDQESDRVEGISYTVTESLGESVDDLPPQVLELLDEPIDRDTADPDTLWVRDDHTYWVSGDDDPFGTVELIVNHDRTYLLNGDAVHTVAIVDGEPEWEEPQEPKPLTITGMGRLVVTDYTRTAGGLSLEDELAALL